MYPLFAELLPINKGNGAYFLAALDFGVRGDLRRLGCPLGVVGVLGGLAIDFTLLFFWEYAVADHRPHQFEVVFPLDPTLLALADFG